MAAKPFISICIPVYNGARYLVECLDSCLQQSFTDYELIICDDGSSDESRSIIESYQKTHPTIHFFKNTVNLGLVGNWNRCLDLAKGDWIKFVFQDDFISKDCLEKFVSAIKNDTQLLVSKRTFLLPENASSESRAYYTETIRTLKNSTHHNGSQYSAALISNMAVKYPAMNFIAEPSHTLFRKSVLSELGYFTADLKQICDLEFFLRIASKYGLIYLDEALCTFRVHENSTTASNLSTKLYDIKYLEPIIFACILLYNKQYLSFRRHLSILNKIKLNLYFKLKVYQAYSVNVAEQKNHPIFQQTITNFKQIADNKNGSLTVKLISYLKK